MNAFWKSDTYRIVRKMRDSGNKPGVIALWKNMVAHWAERTPGADAEAVKAFLPLWQARQLYSGRELAPIFPVLAVALGLRERPDKPKGAARLANELRMAGLPHRSLAVETYFAVERCHFWQSASDAEWAAEIYRA